ncbi:MAG: hypothetical protein ACI89X_002787 [Planctomycetota bacterium]|jgi:hypothetical protein
MITSILSLLSIGGPTGPAPSSAPLPAPVFHAIAFVTDPLSHGVVGDGLLSLNEAIRLHNGTLTIGQLSVSEQLQTSLLPGTGGTGDVTWIEIDAEFTPTITIEQDLESIVNSTFGLFIRGSGGVPTFDFSGAAVTRGILSTSSNLILQDLHLLGGPYGLDVYQSDVTGQPGCSLHGVVFENHTQFGLRVTGTLAGTIGRLIVEECQFLNVPDAIELDETLADRTTIFEAHDVLIAGAIDAIDLAVGTGGTARFTFDRVIIECSGVGIDLLAPATGGRPLLIEGNNTRVRAPVCARFDGANDAVTWMQCGMWSLLATPGGTALDLGVVGNQVYGDINEFRCVGDVTIATGGTVLPLIVRNMRCKDGAVTLSTTASQPLAVTESRFRNCTTDSVGTGAVSLDNSSFEGGSLGSASPAGSLQATSCFIANPGAGVTASQSLTQAHLGSMEVVPDDGLIGGSIQFFADLPAGLVCAFAVGNVPGVLPVLPYPFYVYLDTAGFVFLPGVYLGQQSALWAIPNLSQFRGHDLIVQAIVLPLGGVQAPALQLPPGWRFVLN